MDQSLVCVIGLLIPYVIELLEEANYEITKPHFPNPTEIIDLFLVTNK